MDVQIVLFGEARNFWNTELKLILNENLYIREFLHEAVSLSKEIYIREKFEKLIFSPACASFDQYKNFEERGRDFNSLIAKYYSKHNFHD